MQTHTWHSSEGPASRHWPGDAWLGLEVLVWHPEHRASSIYSTDEAWEVPIDYIGFGTTGEMVEAVVTGIIGRSFAAILASFVGFMVILEAAVSLASSESKLRVATEADHPA